MLQIQAHRQGRKASWVVQAQEGNQTAFALVLAGCGDAWATVELGRGMGPDHTLLALQPPDDNGAPAAALNATDLAARYVRKLAALGALAGALALRKRLAPPTAGLERADYGLLLSSQPEPFEGDYVLVNAFSCGGNNASLVLGAPDRAARQ